MSHFRKLDPSILVTINLLTDGVALFYRASLNGVDIAPARWQALSAYADRFFAKPGIAFADVHAALAHAMAGNMAAVDTIVTGAASGIGAAYCRAVAGPGAAIMSIAEPIGPAPRPSRRRLSRPAPPPR